MRFEGGKLERGLAVGKQQNKQVLRLLQTVQQSWGACGLQWNQLGIAKHLTPIASVKSS